MTVAITVVLAFAAGLLLGDAITRHRRVHAVFPPALSIGVVLLIVTAALTHVL